MKFSDVNAVRIPKNAKRIRHNGKVIWQPISARYVSFGDSIAAGHAINDDWEKNYGTRSQYGNSGNTKTAIVPGCYTDLIHKDLISTLGGNVNLTSFAKSGDRVDDLIRMLDHDRVRNAVAKADYVTLCIGANDVLEPALSHLDEYINVGSLANAEAVIETNFAALSDDNNAYSYKALFDKLSAINPDARFVFTTVYNPYKHLWLEEDRNGFFGPVLNTIPQMNIDVDKIIEDRFLGGKDLAYYDITKWKWVAIELDLDLDNLIKDGLLHTPIVQKLFDRVNGLCDWAERYVNRLNDLLRSKITAYQATNPNFFVAETKAAFDTYPDRPVTADVHYNDLVNVEFTRGYDTAKMDWGALWRDSYGDNVAQYWTDLVWKHLSFSNGFPSLNVADYVSFDLEGFAVDLVTQTIEKVIVPNVDPHPEEYGHIVLKGIFTDVLGY